MKSAGTIRTVGWLTMLSVAGALVEAGCQAAPEPPAAAPAQPAKAVPEPPAAPQRPVVLATTTSINDTGLLDVLVPAFTRKYGIQVKPIAVGTGQALLLGRRGDADALLTHAPAAEEEFMAQGYGERRTRIMHNDMLIVGPEGDPAKIKGLKNAAKALARIAKAKARFVSRGDQSGTHLLELSLWQKAALQPRGDWYIEAGVGMAAALRVADDKKAYLLTDRATYAHLRDGLRLKPLVQGDPALLNIYHVIVANPEKNPRVNAESARLFAGFLVSREIQELIGRFGVESAGEPLFIPDALPPPDQPATPTGR